MVELPVRAATRLKFGDLPLTGGMLEEEEQMSKFAKEVRVLGVQWVVGLGFVLGICCHVAVARVYLFENISDLPLGPGGGRGAEINDSGDIAFLNDGAVWFYDRSEGSFLNVTALPGAPANPFFLKLNDSGNIAIMETPSTTRDYWFFEQATQTFTNVSALPNFPGNSLTNFGGTAFDLNDNDKMSFHSGDNNVGDIYVYEKSTDSFEKITGRPGAPFRGRENEINNLDQVLYMGFPSTYLFDPATSKTTNINTLPGGPGSTITNLDLNDLGDVALMGGTVAQFYNATTNAFLDVTAAPGWVPEIGVSSRSDLSNSGEITFWREGLFVFDTGTQRFSQLNDFPGGPPLGGLETDLNSSGQIVLSTSSDIYLATPRPFGDYDNDGVVDGNDLLGFESTFGETVAIGTAADGDSNRQIDGGDFLVWQRNLGSGVEASSSAGAVIPEPASCVLLLPLLFLTLGRILVCGRRQGLPTSST